MRGCASRADEPRGHVAWRRPEGRRAPSRGRARTGWADRRVMAAALKPVYTAESVDAALAKLDELERKHGAKYPTVIRAC